MSHKPPRSIRRKHHKPWTVWDENLLKTCINMGRTWEHTAKTLGRRVTAVKMHLRRKKVKVQQPLNLEP